MIDRMLGIWERVLHQPVDRDADFFLQLGGDSLRAIELTDAVSDDFGVDLDVGDLFDCPTVTSLAGLVAERDEGKH